MKHINKKSVVIASIATVVTAIAIIAGGFAGYWFSYEEKVLPGISMNGVPLAGLTLIEAQEALQEKHTALLEAGLRVNHASSTQTLDIQLSGSTDPDLVYDVLVFDPAQSAEVAFSYGRNGAWHSNIFTMIRVLFQPTPMIGEVYVLEQPIEDVILSAYGDIQTEAIPTRFVIEDAKAGEVTIEEGVIGEEINFDAFFSRLQQDLADLALSTQTIELTETAPIVTTTEAEEFIPLVLDAYNKAPFTLTYTTPALRDYTWTISKSELSDWITVSRAGKTANSPIALALEHPDLDALFVDIAEIVNVAPQNARFRVEDGVAVEFAGSTEGVSLDVKATMSQLNSMLMLEDENELALATILEQPAITTESVNDLGIKEVLGTGYSSFKGSPANRIANIRHGVSKLDGMLIPPGETVSLVESLKPFTIADGYLPELVIKGDEIKPEIGGGLCQIGSTTFRAVMNSGLQVDERRNHSLVVSYYNDPSNGNPGTDATLYDPAPDFKFTNDTENYILLEAKILDTQELEFTFWGTSDGRKGYYTPPKVLSWTGYGATQYKETTSLAPGVTRCQAPHSGATTTFDYIIERPNGETETITYNSTYRSLPKICLVGVSADELNVNDVN